MRQIVYYYNIQLNNIYKLNKSDSHYIKNVIRLTTNDVINIIDINNKLFLCKIVSFNENGEINFKPIELIKQLEKPLQFIDLYFSIIRANRIDLIIEKCTELNIRSFSPIISNNSIVSLSSNIDKKFNRWRKKIKEAVQQCGRDTIPIINPLKQIFDISIQDNENMVVYLLDEESNLPILYHLTEYYNFNKSISIFVGPEGSFTKEEKSFLINELKAIPVSISNNILRSETASIIAVGLCNSFIQAKFFDK